METHGPSFPPADERRRPKKSLPLGSLDRAENGTEEENPTHRLICQGAREREMEDDGKFKFFANSVLWTSRGALLSIKDTAAASTLTRLDPKIPSVVTSMSAEKPI